MGVFVPSMDLDRRVCFAAGLVPNMATEYFSVGSSWKTPWVCRSGRHYWLSPTTSDADSWIVLSEMTDCVWGAFKLYRDAESELEWRLWFGAGMCIRVMAVGRTFPELVARAALRFRKLKDIESTHMATDEDLRGI